LVSKTASLPPTPRGGFPLSFVACSFIHPFERIVRVSVEREVFVPYRQSLFAPLVLGALVLSGCQGAKAPSSEEPDGARDPEVWEGDPQAAIRLLRPKEGTPEDWAIVRAKASWAWEAGLDSLPVGESMARFGLSFVGTRYTPGTLELTGPEELVVNLQEMDCVTFVENILALAYFIRLAGPEILDSDLGTQTLYRNLLTRVRYRGGLVDGYPSRLHYFTDWIFDNEVKGLVREVTAELGGVEDTRALDFMSQHPEAYRQLANPLDLRAIQERESYLSGLTRYRIPQEEIPAVSAWIKDGDIIAATSTVDGLDVAHTGLAIWRNGSLHLLHAPLVGEVVEVSVLPLADRVSRIGSQDGIRVVRPLEVEARRWP
jgi:hypothetical protein